MAGRVRLCLLHGASHTGEIEGGSDYALFTRQAIQVRLKVCGYAHFMGARHTGEIREVCGYAPFTGKAIQVRLERCVAMLTSRGQSIQVRLERCVAMLTSRGKPHR